ncbi:MAG: peptidoglycan DD-metalloendopeptidase family protein [Actinobacteria bacterium]|nr:peptidoglycan DD-metalloendopeptidase family protein [Deltaproteobacteria bacterium]MCL5772717.1 peptidoglycan DD-metalloendopeptidase family protein [Actinomycetota bacterium]
MNEDKQHKHYTLIIYSGPKDKIRKLTVSQNFLRFIYIIVIIIFASTAILISNLFITRQKLNEKIAEIERVEYKINYKEVELVSLEKKTNEIQSKTKLLENYFKEVQDLDKLVRNITGQGGFESQVTSSDNGLSANIENLNNPNEIFYYTSDQEETIDDINALLDELLAKVPGLADSLQKDKQNMQDYIYLMEHTPSIWPTWGRITTLFCNGKSDTVWIPGTHKGIDIANEPNTPVSAAASGIVIFAGWQGGYGKKIVIYHMDKYTTVYGHLNEILVNVGDTVKQGQLIGKMGSTGYSTGPHLHYEVYVNGVPHNPKEFLP